MSVRDAQYSNPIAQWATAWLGVPFIMGSKPCPEAIDNFEGIDCCDLLIAAHNKACLSCTPIDPCLVYVDMLVDQYTTQGKEGTEGDLIFWDLHRPNEQGPPDGVYDHSMISLGGTRAIWASAGYLDEQGRIRNRCVIVDDYRKWIPMWEVRFGYKPVLIWRRFRCSEGR